MQLFLEQKPHGLEYSWDVVTVSFVHIYMLSEEMDSPMHVVFCNRIKKYLCTKGGMFMNWYSWCITPCSGSFQLYSGGHQWSVEKCQGFSAGLLMTLRLSYFTFYEFYDHPADNINRYRCGLFALFCRSLPLREFTDIFASNVRFPFCKHI